MESKQKLLLRVPEAAEVLGISRSQMYQLVAGNVVPTLRIGKSVRVPLAALEAWIAQHTAEAGAPREAA